MHFDGIADERGELMPIDFAALGFAPVRSFVINAPQGARRGGHGHRKGSQLLLRLSGEIQVDMALDGTNSCVVLSEQQNALLVHAPVWLSQTYRGENPQLIVFSDQPFDPADYIEQRG